MVNNLEGSLGQGKEMRVMRPRLWDFLIWMVPGTGDSLYEDELKKSDSIEAGRKVIQLDSEVRARLFNRNMVAKYTIGALGAGVIIYSLFSR